MTDDDYRATLEAMQAERAEVCDFLTNLEKERETARVRLVNLDASIRTLSALIENAPPEAGLADACRKLLKRFKGRPLSPLQVREALTQTGYDLNRHSNPMAAIHSVLKRLAETPEFTSLNKGQFYRWNAQGVGAPATPTAKK